MTCPACDESRINRWCGAFNAACLECAARDLSHSPIYANAAKAGAITPSYRDALHSVFGKDWREGHAAVKRWAESK